MRILIDTHYVLWTALNPSEMPTWAHRLLADLKNEILVSSASVYEISMKVRLGKIPEAAEFEGDLIANIEGKLGFELLPLDPQSMYRAARFEDKHADPFDRMIAAQAIQYDLPLLSVDPRMDAFGVRRVKELVVRV
jgi:PIN domain nuclease of toxin-antitoxin system